MRFVLVVGAVALAGCSNASLADMRPGLIGNGLQCMLTLKFKKLPNAGDPKDVKVVFSSAVLFEDESYDWKYITENDQIIIKGTDDYSIPDKYQPDGATTAESDPPLGKPMIVQFRIRSRESIVVEKHDDTTLTATLFWAGQKMDASSRGLFLAYQKR